MKKILTSMITIAALAFCMAAGAAGYKQVALTRKPEQKAAPRMQEVTINISANEVFIKPAEPDPVEMVPEDDEIYLLAACVEAEAGNQSLLGKRMVADVILNRVDSKEFPDTISAVITQPYQFSTWWNGAIADAEVTEETLQAVHMELGERSYPSLMFFDCGSYLPYGTPWKQVGDHYFSTL